MPWSVRPFVLGSVSFSLMACGASPTGTRGTAGTGGVAASSGGVSAGGASVGGGGTAFASTAGASTGGGTAGASTGGAGTGGSSSAGSSSAGTSAGGSGPFISPACKEGSSAELPPTAPELTTGTWTDISPAGVPFDSAASAFTQGMTIDPCNPATIYVCVHGDEAGLYRSLDGGANWTEIGEFGGCLNVRVDPEDPLHLYVGSGVRGGSDGFWVSTDGGETFAIPQGFHTAAVTSGYDVYHVAPDPTDFNHVLVSFHYLWKGYGDNAGVLESTDGGDSWAFHEPQTGWGYGGGIFFLFEPTLGVGDNSTWLFGSQGAGFFRTTDGGENWTKVSDTQMTHGGAQLYYTQGAVYVTGGTGLMRSTDNGASWSMIGAGGAHIGMVGDGVSLYTGMHGGGHFQTALESADTAWSDFNDQTFAEGPFEMAFDAGNRIVYSANIRGGVWALKVNE